MEQHFSACFHDVPDGLYGDGIWEIGIYTTVSDSLSLCLACIDESLVGEAAIVTLIVLDLDAMFCGKMLDLLFCLNCFVRCLTDHRINKF